MAQSPASSRGSGGTTLLSYVAITAPVTISGSAASPNTIVTAASVTVDGATLICVEFYSPSVTAGNGGTTLISLWQDSTDLGILYRIIGETAITEFAGAFTRRYLTPSAGSYVYSARGYRATANGSVGAGIGGSDVFLPAYIRVTSGA